MQLQPYFKYVNQKEGLSEEDRTPACNSIGHYSHIKKKNMKGKDVQLIVCILHVP